MPPVLRKLKTRKSLPEEEAIEINPNQGTNINHLPFDCFYLIFRRIDLRTQILTLRTVCHLWHDHITQICASKSHLTLKPYYKPLKYFESRLIIPKDWFFLSDLTEYIMNRTEFYCDNDLEFRLPKIAKLTTNSLINHSSLFHLFGATLTELNLTFDRNYQTNYHDVNINVVNVDKLMKSFTAFTNLRTFKLYISHGLIQDFFRSDHQTIHSLFESISDCITRERLPTLTNLDLNLDCGLIVRNADFIQLNPEISNLDLHLLSQLEHFSMDFHTKRVPLLMGQLNPGLSFLSFNCDLLSQHHQAFKEEALDPALLGEPQFGPNLTHLRLNKVWNLPLKLFCDRFSALQSIILQDNYTCDSFDESLIKPLNQLEQLVELRLHGYRVHVLKDNLDLESRCLPRVKKLTWYYSWLLTKFSRKFCTDRTFDGELFCRTLAEQFENLEELVLVTRENKAHAQQVRDHLYHFKSLVTNFLDFNISNISGK